jgi:tripeptide aminopeptidase
MHGRYEFVPVESMEKAVEVILKIAELATAN